MHERLDLPGDARCRTGQIQISRISAGQALPSEIALRSTLGALIGLILLQKSMLSTATSGSSPPTIASDKGSTLSLSVPVWEQEPSSPSKMNAFT